MTFAQMSKAATDLGISHVYDFMSNGTFYRKLIVGLSGTDATKLLNNELTLTTNRAVTSKLASFLTSNPSRFVMKKYITPMQMPENIQNVSASIPAFGSTPRTAASVVTREITAPTPVVVSNKALKISSLGSSTATITWASAQGSGITYSVYASSANPSVGAFDAVSEVRAGTLLKETTSTSATFDIASFSGKSYFINVIARNAEGGATAYSPIGEVFYNNLTLYYPFNGNAEDISATGNDGTLNNNPSLTADRFEYSNSAYSFVTASSQSIVSSSNLGITSAAARTISMWFKSATTTLTGNHVLLATGTGSTASAFGIFVTSNAFRSWCYGGACDFDMSPAQALTTNWEFWVLSYDGTTFKTYKNGALAGSATRSLTTGDNSLTIGDGFAGGSHFYLTGTMDDVRVYTSALTDSQIEAMYRVTKP
jgi:hypothetical protein